jgi:hypothetical protein
MFSKTFTRDDNMKLTEVVRIMQKYKEDEAILYLNKVPIEKKDLTKTVKEFPFLLNKETKCSIVPVNYKTFLL